MQFSRHFCIFPCLERKIISCLLSSRTNLSGFWLTPQLVSTLCDPGPNFSTLGLPVFANLLPHHLIIQLSGSSSGADVVETLTRAFFGIRLSSIRALPIVAQLTSHDFTTPIIVYSPKILVRSLFVHILYLPCQFICPQIDLPLAPENTKIQFYVNLSGKLLSVTPS